MFEITIKNGSESTVIHTADFDSVIRVSSGKFTSEVNQIPSFGFTVLPSNPCFENGLNDRKTTVEILNTKTNETEFEGSVLQTEKKMTNAGKVCKSCICEGFLGYLCDSIQPYHHYENYTVVEFLTAVLDNHNAQTSEEKHIYLGSCNFSSDNTNSKTTAYRNTLEEIKINLIERIGGEVRVRRVDGRLVLDFLTQYGVKCETTIELAKNIQSLEVSSDSTNIVTRLIPLGAQLNPGETAERLDISSVNDGKMYIDDETAIEKYGIIAGTAEFDDITVPANLKTAGQEYLANNNRVKKAFAAQVLDLSVLDSSQQSIKEGNTYRFRNSLLGLDEDLRVMKRTVDIYEPYKPEIEIGDKAERITDIATRTAQLIEYEMPKQKLDILATTKNIATDIINAGINGHVVVNKNEILIMDTDNKETAKNVWRYNLGGWGVSHNGYAGPFTMAATLDGGFVADFITAGVLRGLEIVNGNGTFHVNTDGSVTASAIEITGGKIHMTTNSADYDAIYLNYGNYGSKMTSMGFAARNISTKNRIDVQGNGIWGYDDYDDTQNTNTFFINSGTGDFTTNGGIHTNNSYTKNRTAVSGDGIWGYDDYDDTENTRTFFINSGTGLIYTIGDVQCNNLHFKLEDDGGTYSLRDWINNLNSRLQALEG